ncbi:hypothetical protein Pen01_02020 [Phytomonospora endophytica]|nr:hypothetical protein Pen01_02020 [Phytomonospora endophytica]
MIDVAGERLLEVPMGEAVFQPPDWPLNEGDDPLPVNPVGRLDGAPSVGTVWTVGMAGGGVVERDTVTPPDVVAEDDEPVGAAARVGVTR